MSNFREHDSEELETDASLPTDLCLGLALLRSDLIEPTNFSEQVCVTALLPYSRYQPETGCLLIISIAFQFLFQRVVFEMCSDDKNHY